MINNGIAKSVIGVDASKDMIDLSIQENKENDQRYEYLVKDVYTLLPDDVDELFSMLSAIRRVCGKFFIGLVPNPSLIDNVKKMKKYGMDICFHKHIKDDGDSFSIIFDFDEPIGFRTCKWVKQHINPQATDEQKTFFVDYTQIGRSFIAGI
ncbi:unnamed protein product [Adineta steineri]|uniref:Uncharacterized protein n=1 Tax=Adineta steineri TaxID=433720 RepID=A0A819SBN4_9BILA|nr:unnamed protein product [Adineta steineri]CAF4060566.1 unnamed protein product [Adineta steineri]